MSEIGADAQPATRGWQPIETAPTSGNESRAGTRVGPTVMVTDGDYIYIAFYRDGWWDDGDYKSHMTGMTHWMPLPLLPAKPEPREAANPKDTK